VDWVLLDARGAPTRIPPEFDGSFRAPQAAFPLGRVALETAPTDARTDRFQVRPQELDPMDHVNNAVYADWLEEQVIAAGGLEATRSLPRVARLEYARAAERGATVVATTWRGPDDGWSCSIADASGSELLRAQLDRG
jgi:acyl-ACP thioesterase